MLEFFRNSTQSWWVRSIFIAIILVFIFLGLGSGGSNTQILAEINGKPLLVHTFLQALESEKKQYIATNPSLNNEILEQIGIRTQTFDRLVIRSLFIQEAIKLGIFTTPKEIQQALLSLPFFKNEEGNFDVSLYKKALENNRTAVLLFEQELSDDVLIDKLVKLIIGAAFVDQKYAKNFYGYFNEERSFEYLLFPKQEYLKNVTLSEEEIRSYYERNATLWQQPAQISFEYIPLTKSSILPHTTISQEEIINEYETNIALYDTITKEVALEKIENELLQKKSSLLIEEYLDRVHASISEGKDIKTIAKELNIPLKKTDLLTKEQTLIRFGITDSIFTRLSKNTAKTIETIPSKKDGEYRIVTIEENIPENIPSLEEIEKDVFYALQDEKSLELAQAAALKVLAKAKANNAILPSSKTTILFSRIAEMPEPFAESTELSDAIFNTPKNSLLETTYPYSDGVALIKVAHVAPASEKNWEEDKQGFTQRVLELKQREFLNLMEQYLRNEAKVVVKLPKLLENQNQ